MSTLLQMDNLACPIQDCKHVQRERERKRERVREREREREIRGLAGTEVCIQGMCLKSVWLIPMHASG